MGIVIPGEYLVRSIAMAMDDMTIDTNTRSTKVSTVPLASEGAFAGIGYSDISK